MSAEEDPVSEGAAENNSDSLKQVTYEEPTAAAGSVDDVDHSPKENGSCIVPVLGELNHDQLVQRILELNSQNEYLQSQFKGLHCHHLATARSDLQTREKEHDGAHEESKELHAKIESLSNELVVEKQTREAAEKALEHVRSAHLEADGRAQELSVKLNEVQHKMEQEIKERDDKYSELDSKFTRLHKRAKQRIQDVQKEKDDLEAKLKEVNEKADRTSSQLSALQQELERTRQQANEALRTMDVERQQLRSANNKLRDNIEELRHSLQPKERALEELQQSLSEKQQMIDDLRGLLKDADEKRQASLADISSKHQKRIESLEAQLADALSDRDKATETISSLQARLVERESEIAELDAALSGEAVRSKAAVETVKGELLNLKHEHEKERENLEASYQAVKRKLEAAESNCIRVEVEAAKTRSQLELELSVKTQSLNSKDSELAAAREEISRLEADFSSYKVRAHSLLQKKDAELASVQDSEQVKGLEEALKEAEMEISSLTAERDQSLEKLQEAFANHGRELKERDASINSLEQRVKNLEKKLDSDNARYQLEKEAWESNLQNVEETWRLKYEGLRAQTEASARPDLEKELDDYKLKYRKLKEEHDAHRDLADRMIEEKDNELSRILAMNKKLQSMESKPYAEDDYRYNTEPATPLKQDTSSAAVAEQQILILARQQAQREEELAQSQRHILALQEEIEELERENRLHNQQVTMLKEELRSMDRTQKREGVDMTYLKNVVLKLLETGEVLALLPVIAMLLQFSPDEVHKCQLAYRNNVASLESPPNGPASQQGSSRSLFSRFSFV